MYINKICKICGKEFKVPHWRKNAKYCSTECQNKSLHGELNCKCEICGKLMHRKPSWIKRYKHITCSKECLSKLKSVLYAGENNHQYGLRGEKNSSFKGVEVVRKNNNLFDIFVYDPSHPHADKTGRVSKHRLIVEQNYKLFDPKYFETIDGRVVLKRTSQVHHIDENHNNNDINNLIPVTRSEHTKIHNGEKVIIRDDISGRIIGVLKRGELLEKPEEVNQQPSSNSNILEGSETSGRIHNMDSNATTSALHSETNEDIVRPTDITNETVDLQNKESVR